MAYPIVNSIIWCVLYLHSLRGRTGQDRTGQDRTGQDRTGQDRTGQDRTQTGQQDRKRYARTWHGMSGQDSTVLHVFSFILYLTHCEKYLYSSFFVSFVILAVMMWIYRNNYIIYSVSFMSQKEHNTFLNIYCPLKYSSCCRSIVYSPQINEMPHLITLPHNRITEYTSLE